MAQKNHLSGYSPLSFVQHSSLELSAPHIQKLLAEPKLSINPTTFEAQQQAEARYQYAHQQASYTLSQYDKAQLKNPNAPSFALNVQQHEYAAYTKALLENFSLSHSSLNIPQWVTDIPFTLPKQPEMVYAPIFYDEKLYPEQCSNTLPNEEEFAALCERYANLDLNEHTCSLFDLIFANDEDEDEDFEHEDGDYACAQTAFENTDEDFAKKEDEKENHAYADTTFAHEAHILANEEALTTDSYFHHHAQPSQGLPTKQLKLETLLHSDASKSLHQAQLSPLKLKIDSLESREHVASEVKTQEQVPHSKFSALHTWPQPALQDLPLTPATTFTLAHNLLSAQGLTYPLSSTVTQGLLSVAASKEVSPSSIGSHKELSPSTLDASLQQTGTTLHKTPHSMPMHHQVSVKLAPALGSVSQSKHSITQPLAREAPHAQLNVSFRSELAENMIVLPENNALACTQASPCAPTTTASSMIKDTLEQEGSLATTNTNTLSTAKRAHSSQLVAKESISAHNATQHQCKKVANAKTVCSFSSLTTSSLPPIKPAPTSNVAPLSTRRRPRLSQAPQAAISKQNSKSHRNVALAQALRKHTHTRKHVDPIVRAQARKRAQQTSLALSAATMAHASLH